MRLKKAIDGFSREHFPWLLSLLAGALLVCSGWILSGSAAFPTDQDTLFVEGGRDAGLDFILTSGTSQKKYIIEANSGGLCLLDFNNDRLLDIYLVNGGLLENFIRDRSSGLQNALFQNLGQRRFKNVTESSGTGGNGAWGMGCSAADYDGDGLLDLYVTTYGDNILYRNRGDGTFEDVTKSAKANDPRWSTGSAWADFDGDGDLDLFVANYIELDRNNLPEPGSEAYGSMGGIRMGCKYLGLDVMCGPRGLRGAGDSFFVNQGNGTFEERSAALGLDDPNGYYGLGAVWSDFNQDHSPDLYVANDSTPNLLYVNNGNGKLSEVGLLSGAAANESGLEQAGMGVATGDYRNEGRYSIYVTNFSEEYNTLYYNEEGANFTDLTYRTGLAEPSLPYVGWGTFFFDFDNDGWLDLFVANGHVFPGVDQLETPSVAGYRQRGLLFQNLQNGRFREIGEPKGISKQAVSRGAVFGDLDGDGCLDMVLSNLDASPFLYWNQCQPGSHYLRVNLEGAPPNRFAVGASVRVKTGTLWQSREVQAGNSYLSQSELTSHFGLGAALQADEVEIRWPDGTATILHDVSADQAVTVKQSSDGKAIPVVSEPR